MLEAGGLDKAHLGAVAGAVRREPRRHRQAPGGSENPPAPQGPQRRQKRHRRNPGGAGGEEAALFVNSSTGCTPCTPNKRWKVEVINANPTELGGFKEICFSIDGEGPIPPEV